MRNVSGRVVAITIPIGTVGDGAVRQRSSQNGLHRKPTSMMSVSFEGVGGRREDQRDSHIRCDMGGARPWC